jgi:hypothetical protein
MATVRRSSTAALGTPTDLSADAVDAVTAALNPLVVDAFALYLKTKNFIGMSAARISATIICCWMTGRPNLCHDGCACRAGP